MSSQSIKGSSQGSTAMSAGSESGKQSHNTLIAVACGVAVLLAVIGLSIRGRGQAQPDAGKAVGAAGTPKKTAAASVEGVSSQNEEAVSETEGSAAEQEQPSAVNAANANMDVEDQDQDTKATKVESAKGKGQSKKGGFKVPPMLLNKLSYTNQRRIQKIEKINDMTPQQRLLFVVGSLVALLLSLSYYYARRARYAAQRSAASNAAENAAENAATEPYLPECCESSSPCCKAVESKLTYSQRQWLSRENKVLCYTVGGKRTCVEEYLLPYAEKCPWVNKVAAMSKVCDSVQMKVWAMFVAPLGSICAYFTLCWCGACSRANKSYYEYNSYIRRTLFCGDGNNVKCVTISTTRWFCKPCADFCWLCCIKLKCPTCVISCCAGFMQKDDAKKTFFTIEQAKGNYRLDLQDENFKGDNAEQEKQAIKAAWKQAFADETFTTFFATGTDDLAKVQKFLADNKQASVHSTTSGNGNTKDLTKKLKECPNIRYTVDYEAGGEKINLITFAELCSSKCGLRAICAKGPFHCFLCRHGKRGYWNPVGCCL